MPHTEEEAIYLTGPKPMPPRDHEDFKSMYRDTRELTPNDYPQDQCEKKLAAPACDKDYDVQSVYRKMSVQQLIYLRDLSQQSVLDLNKLINQKLGL